MQLEAKAGREGGESVGGGAFRDHLTQGAEEVVKYGHLLYAK